MEVKKIVTHVAPRHFDDTMAVSLLLQKYPNAKVEFLHPQDDKEKIEEYIKRKDVILVDIGGTYDEKLKNYDHHQDKEMPCSLVLVLANEFPEYLKLLEEDEDIKKEMEYFDIKDREGFLKAKEKTGVSTSLIQESVILEMGNDVEGLKKLGEAFKKYLDKKLEIINNLEKAKVKKVNGLKVIIDENTCPPSLLFKKYDADLIIQRNSFNKNDTSVIKNTGKKTSETIKLENLKDEAKFVHKAGFIAVLPKEINEVEKDLDKIINKIKEKGNAPSL